MTTYYCGPNEYIENFNIDAKIQDTEERNNMCKYWQDFGYSKIYLIYLSYNPVTEKDYWHRETTYWSGWEWNEENNHVHGLGTTRDLMDFNCEQKNHMVWDFKFQYVISEKKIIRMKEDCEHKMNTVETDEDAFNNTALHHFLEGLLNHENLHISYFHSIKKFNAGKIPGQLEFVFPEIGDLESLWSLPSEDDK